MFYICQQQTQNQTLVFKAIVSVNLLATAHTPTVGGNFTSERTKKQTNKNKNAKKKSITYLTCFIKFN